MSASEPPFCAPLARFCWTVTGKRVHISDDGARTRCGRPVTDEADADDVQWFWPPCGRCSREQ